MHLKLSLYKTIRFPCALKYPEQWQMWISNVKVTKPGFVPSRAKYLNRLCSKHFSEELIIHNDKRATLLPGAIPTIFYTAKQVNFTNCVAFTSKFRNKYDIVSPGTRWLYSTSVTVCKIKFHKVKL